jgi:hypothetical protein
MARFPFTRKLAAFAACALCLCMAFAASAGAEESSDYPTDPAARNFTSSAGNWTSASSFDGSCIAPALCPTTTNAFVPTGGADGNGYITAAFTGVVGVTAVAGTSTSVWESPVFVYAGAGGETPTSLVFTMNRRSSVDQVLAVEGNSAEYSVQIARVGAGGGGPTVIGPTTLAGADTWRAVQPAAIEPGQLKPGDNYRIRITSRYTTGTSVLVSGSADYDNVALHAVRSAGAGNGKGGNGKGNGNGSGNSLSSKRLLSLYRAGMAGTAVLKGNRLFVKVKCPKKIGRACRITAQGLLKKRKPATSKRTVKVRSGKRKQVVLRVKPRFQAKVAKRKRLLVKERVRAGGTTATAYTVRKLIRR